MQNICLNALLFVNRSSRWQLFFKIGTSQYLEENTCVGVGSLFLIKLQVQWLLLIGVKFILRIFYADLIKLKFLWYSLVCFNILQIWFVIGKYSILETVAINLIFLLSNNLDTCYNSISFFPRLQHQQRGSRAVTLLNI